MNSLQSYQFSDDRAVRVVMVQGDPWFVATDLARILGYRDAANMARILPDEWRGTHLMSTLSGEQSLTIIAEGGMWTAIARSNKPEAVQVQRWMFGEVMPSIRRTGRYELDPPPATPLALLEDGATDKLTAAIGLVREARQIFGPVHARSIWQQAGLPMPIVEAVGEDGDPLVADISAILAHAQEATVEDVATQLGWPVHPVNMAQRRRIGAAMRLLGWEHRTTYRDGRVIKVWTRLRPAPASAEG